MYGARLKNAVTPSNLSLKYFDRSTEANTNEPCMHSNSYTQYKLLLVPDKMEMKLEETTECRVLDIRVQFFPRQISPAKYSSFCLCPFACSPVSQHHRASSFFETISWNNYVPLDNYAAFPNRNFIFNEGRYRWMSPFRVSAETIIRRSLKSSSLSSSLPDCFTSTVFFKK